MKLYLDMCVLKRLFDDQSDERIALETTCAVLILERIRRGFDSLIWSPALVFENKADPDEEVRAEIRKYEDIASYVKLTPEIRTRTRDFQNVALRNLDAAHLAFAEASGCDRLITCDDRFLKRAGRTNCLIRVASPIEYWNEVGDD